MALKGSAAELFESQRVGQKVGLGEVAKCFSISSKAVFCFLPFLVILYCSHSMIEYYRC